MKKFRIEECRNGFVVVVQEADDIFVGRYVFTSVDVLISWVKEMLQKGTRK